MMKKKKLVRIVLNIALALSIFGLVNCGSGDNDNNDNNDGLSITSNITFDDQVLEGLGYIEETSTASASSALHLSNSPLDLNRLDSTSDLKYTDASGDFSFSSGKKILFYFMKQRIGKLSSDATSLSFDEIASDDSVKSYMREIFYALISTDTTFDAERKLRIPRNIYNADITIDFKKQDEIDDKIRKIGQKIGRKNMKKLTEGEKEKLKRKFKPVFDGTSNFAVHDGTASAYAFNPWNKTDSTVSIAIEFASTADAILDNISLQTQFDPSTDNDGKAFTIQGYKKKCIKLTVADKTDLLFTIDGVAKADGAVTVSLNSAVKYAGGCIAVIWKSTPMVDDMGRNAFRLKTDKKLNYGKNQFIDFGDGKYRPLFYVSKQKHHRYRYGDFMITLNKR